MEPIYFDTETCGFYGPTVIIQWAEGLEEVKIHEIWTNPIIDTMNLIDKFMTHEGGIIGFNLTFDQFHLCQTYTTLLLLGQKVGFNEFPEDHIDLYATLESEARDGPCLKPVSACDLFLVARKGPYQSTMERGDIRIRRVPTPLASKLATELEERVKIKDIYFARKKDKKAEKWKVYDIEDEDGDIIPDFKDVVLSFAPSAKLKVLAVDALNLDPTEVLVFQDVSVDKAFNPVEYGYAPFATAVGKPGNWKGAWPDVIEAHISHWGNNPMARKYGIKDVEYLPRLYEFFGRPPMDDDDSVLACMVAAVRWRGFKVDIEGIKELRAAALLKAAKTPTAPAYARRYIEAELDVTERAILRGSTKKVVLEAIAGWKPIPCPACDATGEVTFGDFKIIPGGQVEPPATDSDWEDSVKYAATDLQDEDEPIATLIAPTRGVCEVCDGKREIIHPATVRAKAVLDARAATKEVELFDKLILAGRFHASFVVIGTLSSRMAGSDKLNPQGIKKTKEVRSKFPLAFPGYTLCGGDFKSFEVVIADAVYNDPDLRADLKTKNICTGCKGKKVDKRGNPCADCDPPDSGLCDQSIHAIFGTFVYPGMSYIDVINTKGTSDDKYTRSKSAVFAMLYGGEAYTLMTRLGVSIEDADNAYQLFTGKYRQVGVARREVNTKFCSMVQKNGRGTRVEWHEPADYIESVFGFRRYFTLENMICKALFNLAENPPKSWKDLQIKVMRRDREQTATGAVQSALFGAAFQIQAGNTRAAANHVIQSAGAQVTKHLQRKIWDIQPSGITDFIVMPMNVHDELMVPTLPEYVDRLTEVVHETVESFRPRVPLIGIDWGNNLNSWADK